MPILSSILVLAAGINLASGLIVLVSLGIFTGVAVYVNRLSVPPRYPTSVPWNISGGLILIVLVLIFRQIASVWSLGNMEVWRADFWQNIDAQLEGGQAFTLKLVIVLEIAFNSFLVVAAAFLLLLFSRTRDIFPRTFMIVLIAQELFIFLDTVLVSFQLSGLETEGLRITMVKSILRWLIAGLLIGYVTGSIRSKHTFVVPYRNHEEEDDPGFLADLEEENKKRAL
ncbi:DUF2569 family protein [Chitinophaga sp. GCM10012297]|uniref:DUF2569 family protein n=1 Tax=Chitinophaga chungangae TaxID=2821488 RepID=A0ABS3YFB6_9BACT|nr:DUF2569 family protein [Chitinophaga chungangae]MBO9152799.1 DUF2569 family protein [Chitinophaga chungangae]